MQDAITSVINSSDTQGLYLDDSSMSKLESYFTSGELRVRAATTISANAAAIVRDAVAKALLVLRHHAPRRQHVHHPPLCSLHS